LAVVSWALRPQNRTIGVLFPQNQETRLEVELRGSSIKLNLGLAKTLDFGYEMGGQDEDAGRMRNGVN
jgi:hypothetical protein